LLLHSAAGRVPALCMLSTPLRHLLTNLLCFFAEAASALPRVRGERGFPLSDLWSQGNPPHGKTVVYVGGIGLGHSQ